MRSKTIRVFSAGLTAAIGLGIYAAGAARKDERPLDPVSFSVQKGIKWLVAVQGSDGGWGQDGGETSYVRNGERLESKGNDLANTAVAAAALVRAGNLANNAEYHQSLERAVQFILQRVEQSPADGLSITDLNGTQIQRKLGPYIDTFLTSKLLSDIDGSMGDPQSNARVRRSLQKCVAKIERNQLKDGSWNLAGGWAPILGTSMASQSLFRAQAKGVQVDKMALYRVQTYTQSSGSGAGIGSGSGGGSGTGRVSGGIVGGVPGGLASTVGVDAASAGVSLYKGAQELEQLSRTPEARKMNAPKISAITGQLSDPRFVTGFGSMGGEEFFSYLNISDSLHRTGGPEWDKWNTSMKAKIMQIQNDDGTWAGHHCITGRVAVTSAAILTLLAERDQVVPTAKAAAHK